MLTILPGKHSISSDGLQTQSQFIQGHQLNLVPSLPHLMAHPIHFYTFNWQMSGRVFSYFTLRKVATNLQAALQPTSTPVLPIV